jgi:mannose-6-phosphate isomerase
MSLYPLTFAPIYQARIWGGRNLGRLFGRKLPGRGPIGESWELADLTAGQTPIARGPDKGKPLAQLLRTSAADILGRAAAPPDGRFPLLLKYLDANDILSLQVHPDERAARRLGPPAAVKTECWYIVESRGGFILKGVKPGVTKKDFRQALASEAKGEGCHDLEELVQWVPVKTGDFHYIPAGTVHALGAGAVVAEIQTPSDTTYRVSDWGRGRQVHVEQALACIHFEPAPAKEPRTGLLVSNDYFTARLQRRGIGRKNLPAGACRVWMTLAGKGVIEHAGPGRRTPIVPGQTVVIPAALDAELVVAEPIICLETTLP